MHNQKRGVERKEKEANRGEVEGARNSCTSGMRKWSDSTALLQRGENMNGEGGTDSLSAYKQDTGLAEKRRMKFTLKFSRNEVRGVRHSSTSVR